MKQEQAVKKKKREMRTRQSSWTLTIRKTMTRDKRYR